MTWKSRKQAREAGCRALASICRGRTGGVTRSGASTAAVVPGTWCAPALWSCSVAASAGTGPGAASVFLFSAILTSLVLSSSRLAIVKYLRSRRTGHRDPAPLDLACPPYKEMGRTDRNFRCWCMRFWFVLAVRWSAVGRHSIQRSTRWAGATATGFTFSFWNGTYIFTSFPSGKSYPGVLGYPGLLSGNRGWISLSSSCIFFCRAPALAAFCLFPSSILRHCARGLAPGVFPRFRASVFLENPLRGHCSVRPETYLFINAGIEQGTVTAVFLPWLSPSLFSADFAG